MNQRTFLLIWNPDEFSWDTLDDDVQKLEETGILEDRWSCGVRTDLPIDSRVFLMRLGKAWS